MMDTVAEEFSTELRRRLGISIREIFLFGSRAREDAREDSDYDMLVVVEHRTPEIRSVILDIENNILDRHGVLVATVLRSEEEWKRSQGFPFALNIAKDGLAL